MSVHVHVKAFESGFEFRHISFSGIDFCILSRAGKLGDDHRGQNADHDQHDHDFNEREA